MLIQWLLQNEFNTLINNIYLFELYNTYNMAISMKGFKLKPKYEELIGVAVSDKFYNIKFPNRDATFLRNGFVLSQLDGEGMTPMQIQQEQASK